MIWNCYHLYKHNIEFIKNQNAFQFSYLLLTSQTKKHVMYWENYKHLL
jgi:hypothetical protein